MTTGEAKEPRIFRELLPSSRDVTTALLLDGSSSLGVHGGRIFRLELACADALSRAMTHARERHGIFVFTGNTRHRVDVGCLKDFEDPRFVPPSGLGLQTGGYTRLGAPLRHLTSRLLAQPSERRLLIVIGDGLISDEGYEGRYAWADAAHAVEEANDAGVSDVLRRRRPHPGRPTARSVRAPSVAAHPTRRGAPTRAGPRAP